MPTPNFGLPLYGPGDTAALDTLLNGQSSALDTALLANVWNFGGTDAQRLAMVAPKLREGIRFRTTDTDRDWLYDGSNWLPFDGSGYLLRPTSVVGGTVSTDGAIVPTVNSAISINGVFTARFREYRIEFYVRPTASAGMAFKFRRAGTDLTGTNYVLQQVSGAGGTPLASAVTLAYVPISQPGLYLNGELTLVNPGSSSSVAKGYRGTVGTVPASITMFGGGNSAAEALTSFDGISFDVGASTFHSSGESWFKIYGLV